MRTTAGLSTHLMFCCLAGLRARTLKCVGVLGGGLMGSGIATALALAGYTVLLKEVNQQFLDVSGWKGDRGQGGRGQEGRDGEEGAKGQRGEGAGGRRGQVAGGQGGRSAIDGGSLKNAPCDVWMLLLCASLVLIPSHAFN